MNKNEIILALNELIRVCEDGEQGLKTCIEDASDHHPHVKITLGQCQHECDTAITELRNVIQAQGGSPEITQNTGTTLFLSWLNLKITLAGKNDAAVLLAFERIETDAIESYRKMLEIDFPIEIRMVIERQYQGFLRNFDKIKRLLEEIRTGA